MAPRSWEKWLESSGSDRVLQTVRTGAELERAFEERRRRTPLSVRSLEFPRGSLIEVCGPRSSGRFALALAALAAATSAGEAAALVDPADQLDPFGALSAGVSLGRMLWVRPPKPRQVHACAEALLDAGFSLVVLDLGEAPAARRAPHAAWLRLARAARSQHSILLVVSAAALCGTAADAQLCAQKVRTLWDREGPPLLSGIASSLSVRHRRRLGALAANNTLSLTGPAE